MPRKDEFGKMMVKDIRRLVVDKPSTIRLGASVDDLLKTMMVDTRMCHVYLLGKKESLVGSFI